MTSLIALPLSSLVICAAFTDAKRRKIPNWLTGMGILAAFALRGITTGWSGFGLAGKGLLVAFISYFALYLLRALGAGDVKLMAAVGAFAGTEQWIRIFIATALVGALAALLLAIYKGKLRSTLWNTRFIATEIVHLRTPFSANNALDVRNPSSLTMPHGIAVAAGVLINIYSTSALLIR